MRYGPARHAHGHEDHTSILWWARGRLLLTDTGHVGYETSWRRDHTRSSEAHNVTVAEGLPLRSVATTLTRRVRRPAGDFLETEDRPYAGVQRRRSALFLHGFPAIVVFDRLHASRPRTFTQLWHLPRGMRTEVRGRGLAVATPGSGDLALRAQQVPLAGTTVPAGSTSVVTGRREPPLGWVARAQREWRPAPVVTMRRFGRTASILTVLVAGTTAASTRIEVDVEATTGGWHRLVITSDGTTRTVRVSPGGYLSV
jgi:hypothetical protein